MCSSYADAVVARSQMHCQGHGSSCLYHSIDMICILRVTYRDLYLHNSTRINPQEVKRLEPLKYIVSHIKSPRTNIIPVVIPVSSASPCCILVAHKTIIAQIQTKLQTILVSLHKNKTADLFAHCFAIGCKIMEIGLC